MSFQDIALICTNLFAAAALAAGGDRQAGTARWMSFVWLAVYVGTLALGIKE